MTESQQSKRGWFSNWRELRRARRRQYGESELHQHHRAEDAADRYASASTHGHRGPIIYGSAAGFGGDGGGFGGGCGGDGGGGGC